ncbi:MAG: TIGR00269 family protein [Candidatus Bathyarchaeota archaeon]|nr:TIGR00269 family protein [Candidatus Bathyarchaeota archaeon]
MSSLASQCSACKRRQPFFSRAYSGERLCRRCFAESVEDKVRATIVRHRMLEYNDHVAVAVSGGKDSLTLLEVLAKMERNYPRATLVAVTVDEGIRGYRDEAMEIAAATCTRLGIQNHTVSFKQLYGYTLDEIVERIRERKNPLTPCAFCGVLRRKALNVAALEVNANKIATGHTLDDEVQTSLLNIFHGDVPKIAAEGPVTGKVHPRLVQKVKPLCEIPERESALYAYVKDVAFQSTPCPYAGEAMRNDIRALLNRMEERHAGTKFTVSKSIARLRPALAGLNGKSEFQACRECGEPAAGELCMACQLLKQIQ